MDAILQHYTTHSLYYIIKVGNVRAFRTVEDTPQLSDPDARLPDVLPRDCLDRRRCSRSTCPDTVSLQTIPSLDELLMLPAVASSVYRGFYGELPVNKYNPNPGNSGFSSDLIAFTTDKRMEKFKDLGGVEGIDASSSSTGSSNVEMCFWIPSSAENPIIGRQWRIRGRCYVLPRDLDSAEESVKETKKWLVAKIRKDGGGDGEQFDFVREHKAHFGNLSPKCVTSQPLRGSFRNPLPGAPKELGDQGLKPSRPIGDDELNEETAQTNFRVAVIEPSRVEYLDLEKPSRTVWVPVGSDAEETEKLSVVGKVVDDWREVELWP
ncbi:hypothetical protein Dda_2864 [Drechslerella dactyloides]|uniref:Pyridoxamine 5'-phosphate oxidase Alr4036 family FMN-binding domain-containing protein n=1 Tax=Drechslerella dactyloides TaxID=74499 RepID=A0AAD6NL90_DREDA|nr:hypothetical protein Dda_2864 [Drechslerella dactyloides]